jgi:cytochrome d ubiquinol oxidase subunit I
MFVLAISAWYLRKGRNVDIARRSFAVAASFGLAASLSVVVLGDESGYNVSENQKMKLAAIEAMWETEPPPASFTVFGFPDAKSHATHYALRIPWVMGLIGTRSIDTPMPGIAELVADAAQRVRRGLVAYDALLKVRAHPDDAAARAELEAHAPDLGYALLLKKFIEDPRKATDADIEKAANSTVPDVPVLFWSFRVMVACGFYFIGLFAAAFWFSSRRMIEQHPRFLRLALWSLPLPWLAAELGWIVAEYGRQPWAIEGVLPTNLGVSSLSALQVSLSLGGFVLFYSTLAVIDAWLMTKFARKGPDGLGMWPHDPAKAERQNEVQATA